MFAFGRSRYSFGGPPVSRFCLELDPLKDEAHSCEIVFASFLVTYTYLGVTMWRGTDYPGFQNL